ncbi:MAG: Uma2 family endonuclease [Chloroflexota bacterium]
MASEPERVILTYDDLVDLPNDRNRHELFDGEFQVTAAPNTSHQTAVFNLGLILGNHVRRHRLGRMFAAPCDVLLSETTVVEPDLLFVSNARQAIVQPGYVRGVSDLVIEVLSPSTAQVDRGIKRQIYARFGVPSYWRLDPNRQEFLAETLEGGVYRRATIGRESQVVTAPPFLDLEIDLAEVWTWGEPAAG